MRHGIHPRLVDQLAHLGPGDALCRCPRSNVARDNRLCGLQHGGQTLALRVGGLFKPQPPACVAFTRQQNLGKPLWLAAKVLLSFCLWKNRSA